MILCNDIASSTEDIFIKIAYMFKIYNSNKLCLIKENINLNFRQNLSVDNYLY